MGHFKNYLRWVLGAALLLVYTVVKFYLLKPNHVPQPEKEHIRVGSPLGSSTGAYLFHALNFVNLKSDLKSSAFSCQEHQCTKGILRVWRFKELKEREIWERGGDWLKRAERGRKKSE